MMVAKIIFLLTISMLRTDAAGASLAGSYTILVDGKPAGVERFEQAATAQSLIMKSTTEITAGGQTEKIIATTELRGTRLVRYEMESSGGGRSPEIHFAYLKRAWRMLSSKHTAAGASGLLKLVKMSCFWTKTCGIITAC